MGPVTKAVSTDISAIARRQIFPGRDMYGAGQGRPCAFSRNTPGDDQIRLGSQTHIRCGGRGVEVNILGVALPAIDDIFNRQPRRLPGFNGAADINPAGFHGDGFQRVDLTGNGNQSSARHRHTI